MVDINSDVAALRRFKKEEFADHHCQIAYLFFMIVYYLIVAVMMVKSRRIERMSL